MQEAIILNDVGPRDGLQNQAKILSPVQRLQMIDALLAANVTHIEVGAFVSPKAVPAMSGAAEIVAGLTERDGEFSVLIPNLKGYELAVEAGATTVAMVAYGSEGLARKNVNMSREDAFTQSQQIIERSKRDGVQALVTITTCFVCPYDGPTDPDTVVDSVQRLLDMEAECVIIADTIGAANPAQVKSLMQRLVDAHGAERLACHFHDTRALGVANCYAAAEAGIRRFDASIAGLGGCPFAPGATGNVATEDLALLFESMGFATGVDMPKLIEASDLAEQLTGSAPGGRSKKWLKPNAQQFS